MKNIKHLITAVMAFLLIFIFGHKTMADNIRLWSVKKEIDVKKVWTIKFNKEIDGSAVNSKNISVTDSRGDKIDTSVDIGKDKKSIVVSAANSFKQEETYYLNISDSITSIDGKQLNQGIKMPFIINKFKLGDDQLINKYKDLIDGKKVGLVTNQTGVNSDGKSIIDILASYDNAKLTALYAPEHGIDGKAPAGEYLMSYTHPTLNIPVYSLYGDYRKPSKEMLNDIDVLVFDIQDIGCRSYTFMSTMNYCMIAAKENNKPIIILDRPNPLGGNIVDGPVAEDSFLSFVGIDNMPYTHGMTAGELARFFNRKINADLTVVPMEGYRRNMTFQETGLKWVQSSPYIPDIDSVFGYPATGLGEGTGIYMDDYFKWVGGKGIDSNKFAELLNNADLPGVKFIAQNKSSLVGGVRLNVIDYHSFNPAKTGIYILAYAYSLNNFNVPQSTASGKVMFDKIMGTNKIGQALVSGYSPQQIEALYKESLDDFKVERKKYLISDYD